MRSGAEQFPHDWGVLKRRLRVRIASRAFTDAVRLQTSADAQALDGQVACMAVAADWQACLLLDSEQHSMFLPQLVLDLQEIEVAHALECALANRAADGDYQRQLHRKITVFRAQESFVLAELLLDKRRRHELGVNQPIVALMPTRFTLLLAPADDTDAVRNLFTLAVQLLEDADDYCSALPIALRDDEWVSFTPPSSLDREFSVLRHHIQVQNYGEQQGVLERHLQRHGRKEQVARLVSAWHPAASRYFYTAVYQGGRVLLPEADILICFDPDAQEMYFTLWSDIREHDPQCLEHTEWSPPRWRMRRFPKLPPSCRSGSPEPLLLKQFGADIRKR